MRKEQANRTEQMTVNAQNAIANIIFIKSRIDTIPIALSNINSLPNQLRKEENFECTRVHDKIFLPDANDKISNL
ncbi:hypothetical protein [Falsiporphyromonas endometrii]|uniref:Uncharacterized protein n=1 Tax=Falsiporphyromonas endometrii TaxID=1387297 RepID=A0ABV9K5G0_9PORP